MAVIKTLWVREPYLAQILSGRKTVEVRVGYDNIRRLLAGDQLKLNDEHLVAIQRVAHYADFEDLVAHEDTTAIAPNTPPQDLLAVIRQIYPPDKEALGAVALELRLPKSGSQATKPESHPTTSEPRVTRYDAILFDMGHTLIYFEPNERLVVQQALRDLGLDLTIDQIQAAIQAVWGDYYRDAETTHFPATRAYDDQVQLGLARDLLHHVGLPSDPNAAQAHAGHVDALFSRPGAMRLFPDVLDVLAALKEAGYRLAIVSNWSWNLRDRVAQAGLDGWFELVWASAYAGCNKPHPAIFHQALDQMNLTPDRVLYVGDSYQHDVVGARNAGIQPVLLDRAGIVDDPGAAAVQAPGAVAAHERGGVQNPDCPVITGLWGIFDLL